MGRTFPTYLPLAIACLALQFATVAGAQTVPNAAAPNAAGSTQTAASQVASAAEPAQNSNQNGAFDSLQNFLPHALGIDPQTGEFTPAGQNSDGSGWLLDSAGNGSGPANADALQKVLQQLDDDTLNQLASAASQAGGYSLPGAMARMLSIYLGVILVLSALFAIVRQLVGWQLTRNDPLFDDFDRQYFFKRYRRRLLSAAILLAVGILIPVGAHYLSWSTSPQAFVLYWTVVATLVVWMIALRTITSVAAKKYTRQTIARLRQHQVELARQLEEIQKSVALRHSSPRLSNARITS